MVIFWMVILAGVAALAPVQGKPRTEHLLNREYSVMLQLVLDLEDKEAIRCMVFNSWEVIFEELSHHPGANMHVLQDEPLSEFVELCRAVSGDIGSIPTDMIVFPGTKWCGLGNTAQNFDDLGEHREADRCCREHDLCPDALRAGQSAHGLTNDGIGTISNCLCDHAFSRCLRKNGDTASETVGILFFNVLQMKCFRLEHPISECIGYYGRSDRTCQEYVFDYRRPKIHQFFDPRHFDTAGGKSRSTSARSEN